MPRPNHLSRVATSPPHESEYELDNIFPTLSPSLDRTNANTLLIKSPWKRTLYELLEQPDSSAAAFLVHVLTTSLILFSAVVTVLETVSYFHSISPRVWFGIETSIVALFTVEYVARALAWSSSWRIFFGWFLSFFGIIDLLAILPYYIEIALQVDTSAIFRFSILRTFRLLRMFRAFRYNNTILLTIEVMYLSFRRSQHALLALGFFVVMFLVVFSTLLYFTERGTWDPLLETFIDVNGDPSQFASIPAAAWFVLVTISTVGYGEITPRSFLGRLITIPLLVFGLLLIALPSFVLGREFSIVWDMMGGERPGLESLDSASLLRRDRNDRTYSSRTTTTEDLNRQIIDLQGALDAQGLMLRRLMDMMIRQNQGPGRPLSSNGRKNGDPYHIGSASSSDADLAVAGSSTGLGLHPNQALGVDGIGTGGGNRRKGKARVDVVDVEQGDGL